MLAKVFRRTGLFSHTNEASKFESPAMTFNGFEFKTQDSELIHRNLMRMWM